MYQYLSLSILFPRSIAAFLKVVYSSGAGVVPKGNHRQRKSSLSTIDMQVYPVVAFAWTWTQPTARSMQMLQPGKLAYQ